MTSWLILFTVVFPLVLSLGFVLEGTRRSLSKALPVAALPGLVLALTGDSGTLAFPWLLEGAVGGLDELRRVFLAFSTVIWTVAGIFSLFYFPSPERSAHFAVFWLLALAGNLGLILALDIASFYSFFALMTLASFGLVAHWRNPQALHAGAVYIAMALAGEMALLSGLIIAVTPDQLLMLAELPEAVAASEYRNWIIALLFTGFGVKAGALGLHMWMPLAYAAAPGPGSAVLGGAMLNAGLFGWLYTLPLGVVALPGWSMLLTVLGFCAAFGAALPGCCQRDPKAVLAYSSISQMGLITMMVGVGFAAPDNGPVIVAAITVYAMHHGLAKTALFLGQGAATHAGALPVSLFWLLNALPALALAGLLMTSGAAAKHAFKDTLALAGAGHWYELLLSLAAIATTLLVARFLYCLRSIRGTLPWNAPLTASWILAVACSALLFWWLPLPPGLLTPAEPGLLAAELADGLAKPIDFLWPVLIGLVIAVIAWRLRLVGPGIPPGDLLVLLEWFWLRCLNRLDTTVARLDHRQLVIQKVLRHLGKGILTQMARHLEAEQYLRSHTGLAFALLIVALLAVLLW